MNEGEKQTDKQDEMTLVICLARDVFPLPLGPAIPTNTTPDLRARNSCRDLRTSEHVENKECKTDTKEDTNTGTDTDTDKDTDTDTDSETDTHRDRRC